MPAAAPAKAKGRDPGNIRGISQIMLLAPLVAGFEQADTAERSTPAQAGADAGRHPGRLPAGLLLDQEANYRTYAKGAKDDPQQIVYQASLADSTRQCVQSETQLTMTVVAQVRLVSGPAGGRTGQSADPRCRHRRRGCRQFAGRSGRVHR